MPIKSWKDIIVGQTIILENIIKKDYIIKSIRHIEDEKTGIIWRFFQLESDDNMWMLIKIVDQNFDLRVYFEPGDFKKGNREDMVTTKRDWMFEEPEDPIDFEFDDLEFIKTFTVGENDEVEYHLKPTGLFMGIVQNIPPIKNIDNSVVYIAEYDTKDETQNTEAMFIEIGDEKSNNGGDIMMLFGTSIRQEDVEVKCVLINSDTPNANGDVFPLETLERIAAKDIRLKVENGKLKGDVHVSSIPQG